MRLVLIFLVSTATFLVSCDAVSKPMQVHFSIVASQHELQAENGAVKRSLRGTVTKTKEGEDDDSSDWKREERVNSALLTGLTKLTTPKANQAVLRQRLQKAAEVKYAFRKEEALKRAEDLLKLEKTQKLKAAEDKIVKEMKRADSLKANTPFMGIHLVSEKDILFALKRAEAMAKIAKADDDILTAVKKIKSGESKFLRWKEEELPPQLVGKNLIESGISKDSAEWKTFPLYTASYMRLHFGLNPK
ncbi:unnamed protein product [Phytophthora lilii]|uniref:RxLR effector protein n=1 Tax=Phytophthora lilii TaxID=2077276 RepID=A0A9W7DAI3_9STRA|nr:unnamed protein product [Phytophthora lilii]